MRSMVCLSVIIIAATVLTGGMCYAGSVDEVIRSGVMLYPEREIPVTDRFVRHERPRGPGVKPEKRRKCGTR